VDARADPSGRLRDTHRPFLAIRPSRFDNDQMFTRREWPPDPHHRHCRQNQDRGQERRDATRSRSRTESRKQTANALQPS